MRAALLSVPSCFRAFHLADVGVLLVAHVAVAAQVERERSAADAEALVLRVCAQLAASCSSMEVASAADRSRRVCGGRPRCLFARARARRLAAERARARMHAMPVLQRDHRDVKRFG